MYDDSSLYDGNLFKTYNLDFNNLFNLFIGCYIYHSSIKIILSSISKDRTSEGELNGSTMCGCVSCVFTFQKKVFKWDSVCIKHLLLFVLGCRVVDILQ
jgi:hypothetical protein